jgi:hypothetical protein
MMGSRLVRRAYSSEAINDGLPTQVCIKCKRALTDELGLV